MANKTTLLSFLIDSGLRSRRKFVEDIKQGLVKVNGIAVNNLRHPLAFPGDKVTLDGKLIAHTVSRLIYLLLNKPVGVVTTTNDEMGRQSVTDLIPEEFRKFRLYPVGRLDRDSSGLLLLTNDGNLTYKLTHPKFEYEKEYLVSIHNKLNSSDIKKLETGIMLTEKKTSPARIITVRNSSPYLYSITIHEGQKRQVRQMFEEIDHQVLTLKRVRLGSLKIGNLRQGQVRELTLTELKTLLSTKNVS